MSVTYSITRLADEDLVGIWAYIARDNPDAARRILERFDEQFRLLTSQPLMGEKCDDLAPNLRRVPVGRYVIYYRFENDVVRIVRVLHGARNVPGMITGGEE